jgi:hypothetical protein
MKYILYLLLLPPLILSAQLKHDHTWIIGYGVNVPSPPQEYGGMKLSFSNDSVSIELVNLNSKAPTGVANDAEGNFQFYTSGCSIYDPSFQIMDNGYDINNGTNEFCWEELLGDQAIRSGTVVLPVPDYPQRYVVLYLVLNIVNNGFTVHDRMMLAEVDMSYNNGLGRVTRKNELLIADSLVDAVSAVRHANGRDWWVVVPRGTGREFWTILINPQGVQAPVLQSLPLPYTPFTLTAIVEIEQPPYYAEIPIDEYRLEAGNTQSGFSPDGRRFCRLVKEQEVEIYDFDRCTGSFSLRRLAPIPHFNYPMGGNCPAMGMAISPNSRYLYFNNNEELYQMDISDDSVDTAYPLLIDAYDGYLQNNFFASNFFQMRTAPDGKIYMTSGNGVRSLHVINKPNEPGMACQFVQRGLELPRWQSWTINYFPNFNLGPEIGSVCDSLPSSTTVPKQVLAVNIQPNPAQDVIRVSFDQPFDGLLQVHNIAGVLLREYPCAALSNLSVATDSWPNGVYILQLIAGKQVFTQKVVVQH